MLENVHDIAPGANLAFATAGPNELAFANNIKALANQAGAKIIADDVSYSSEPMFQNGIVAQAINAVTAQGVTYFSAAGNQANQGYLSTFRAANATVAGIGTGTFMNFNPNGGTSVEMPITTDGSNAEISFQYDQPYQFQEPAGSPGVVQSNVNIYILDSSGNVVVGASANQNNVATQQPWQDIVIPNAGSYEVVIQVMSGPNPGHVEFVNVNENVNLIVNPQYGSAGGTYYPTSFGHETATNTIGVGATPWWAPAPYLNQQPLASEPFSSYGPGLYLFNANGTPKTPVLSLNPTVTAPDGGNTSFFTPGQTIDTSNPPFPGEPATSTNLAQPNLPTFFGTSSATPNAAAVAALMEQLVPNLTPTDVRAALIASAANQPMNGAAPGTWAADGGYGLVNAIDALNAVSNLSVAATTPAQGSTVTSAPTDIQVTFNKAVNTSTLSASDLSFSTTPAGVSVVVGAPFAVTNANGTISTSVFDFPITFVRTPGSLANGAYSFTVQSPAGGQPVVSIDGKDLISSGAIKFSLADTTAPVITGTSIDGRVITIQFSKPLDPSTVTLSNFMVLRQNGAPGWPPTPSTVGNYFDLSNDPRARISYNASTDTVTLDYSALPQTEMPSDSYAIVVQTALANGGGVTDIVGNALDGYYTGSFPTVAYNNAPYDFIQNLGYEALQAPTITTFTMSPTSDTGIAGDQNTNNTQPQFIGQLYVPFPGSISGDQVYVQFSGDNGGATTLAVGGGGRGYTGAYDVSATTDPNGTFTVSAPVLPEGFQTAVAVAVGQADLPPLPGYAGSAADAFRIDKTSPEITGASFTQGGAALPLPNGPQPNITNVSSLSTLSLNVVDPVNPQAAPFGTPQAVQFSALDPSTASNVSNYSLVNVTTNTDESQYVATAAFVPTSPTVNAAGYVTAFNGYINLTFTAGLPTGTYEFVVHTHELQYPGITDAAGNYLNDTSVTGEGTKDFILNFAIQTTPTYITSMAMESSYSANGSTVVGGAQSYYELPPASGTNTRDNVSAPPTTFVVDLSNPIPYSNYTPDLLLVRSANSPGAASDGEFGTLGQGGLGTTGSGFTVVPGTTVTLYNYNTATGTSTAVQSGGSGNRLVLTIQAGTTLPADVYRLYMPNQVEPNGTDTRIFDIYGHQLDGQFLGTPTSQQSPDFPGATVTLPEYQDQMSNGTIRMNDMSGTGNAGGAFMTGFTVVPYGNVVYARPGFVENPLLPNGAGLSNGSLAAPYPVLAPEGDPATAPANPTHDPNGGLNSPFFFQPGNFNLSYDYSGTGTFQQSAFYAASQLSYNGPVVVVAEPGLPSRNPLTGSINQPSFSLIDPAGNTNAGASVPFNTMLVMQAGSAIKFQGTALFVQNQGSALQAQGTTANPVYFTSYNDASIGGPTNNNLDTQPHAGDWGGIVFRNFDYAATQPNFPVMAGQTTGALIGLNGGNAISGAQDAMSIIDNAVIRYGGGNVPGSTSAFYSGITLYNSRPTIANSSITNTGGTGGTVGAIGADFNSLREDDTARGPLIRNVTVQSDNINGFYLFAEPNGIVEPTNAMTYPTNPTTLGGAVNYTMAIPLPIVVTGQIFVGQQLLENTGGDTQEFGNRLYIQPGSLLKFNKGSALDVVSPQASLNVGSRSYINGFDQNPGYNPNSPGFVAPSASDPTVLFTTIYDDTASTPFVPAINVLGEQVTPTLTPGMWGSVGILTGATAVVNAATFQYGGGAVNTQQFTIPSQSVLSFITGTAVQTFPVPSDWNPDAGTHAYITNNNFYHNFDAAMQIEPNGLLAGNPLTPLESGHPFFHGNVMVGNGIDGLSVVTNRAFAYGANQNLLGPIEVPGPSGYVNQSVSAVWDATDLTYVLQGTIVLGPGSGGGRNMPTPNTTTWSAEPNPTVTLTIQAALPGTLLADGSTIPSPGQSVIVKLLSDFAPYGAGSLATPASSTALGQAAGAGFVAGVDNGVDPPADPLIDPGAYSEIRILGIPGNATTGQQRVPVIITSLRDTTVGTTVRGVQMYNIAESLPAYTQSGASLTTPAPGDGGYIMIGGNSMTEYSPTNPFDGSIISNADISYMTRIDVSGGGIVNTYNNVSGTPGAATLSSANWYDQLAGYYAPVNQLNAAMSFTIADSNLTGFSDAAVFVHPGPAGAINFDWTGANGGVASTPAAPVRNPLMGEPVYLYMYNNTITNSGQGVHINSTTGNDTTGTGVYEAVLLNNTFYGDTTAVQTEAPAHTFNPDNSLSSVDLLAMNNIFDNSSAVAVDIEGQAGLSQLQYNLFYQNGTNVVDTTNVGDFRQNNFPIYGDPQFVGPIGSGDASAQNYELKSTSIAIDAGRSEIGPNAAGNAIYPGTTYTYTNGQLIGIRTDPYTLPTSPTQEYPGKSDPFGDFGGFHGGNTLAGGIDPRQIVTLPGSGQFSFPDQWQPVLPGTPNSYTGPSSNAETYNYQPYVGIRDILGYIRYP
ncbi:MAG: S8 family serine peptidase, partial [Isosphaeraceae bacterium]